MMHSLELAHHVLAKAIDHALSRQCDQRHLARLAGLEPHRGSGRDVEPHAARLGAVEFERRVGFEEMIVRAHLDRSVAGIRHRQGHGPAASIELDLALLDEVFAGDHASLLHALIARRASITAPSNARSSAAFSPRQPATTCSAQSTYSAIRTTSQSDGGLCASARTLLILSAILMRRARSLLTAAVATCRDLRSALGRLLSSVTSATRPAMSGPNCASRSSNVVGVSSSVSCSRPAATSAPSRPSVASASRPPTP